ncbi:hypothetical protein [Streptacidiphilus sp. PAMC 29251]
MPKIAALLIAKGPDMLWFKGRRGRVSRPESASPAAAAALRREPELIYSNEADEVITKAEWEILVPAGKARIIESTVNGGFAVVTMWDGVRTVEGNGDPYWIEQVRFRACARSWKPKRLLTRAQAKEAHDEAVLTLDGVVTAIASSTSGDHGLDLSN